MKEIGYEGLLQQQKMHQAFIDKIEVINLENLDDNQQECINELIDFCTSWLGNHIMKMDQKIPTEQTFRDRSFFVHNIIEIPEILRFRGFMFI